MSRVYAVEDGTDRRFLARIECDYCPASIKPHKEINQSGWMKRGWSNGPGTEKHEQDFCPACWERE